MDSRAQRSKKKVVTARRGDATDGVNNRGVKTQNRTDGKSEGTENRWLYWTLETLVNYLFPSIPSFI